MVASILFRSWHGLAFGGLNGLVSGRCRGRGGRSRVLLLDETGQVALDQARGIVEALRRIDQAAEGRADRHVEDERQLRSEERRGGNEGGSTCRYRWEGES